MEKWNIVIDDDGNDDGNDDGSIETIKDKNYKIINIHNENGIIIENKSASSINVKVYNINGSLLNEKEITDKGRIETNSSNGIFIVQITDIDSSLTFSEKIVKY